MDDKTKHHIYGCRPCRIRFIAFTKYAVCTKDGSTLEKDAFYNPCLNGGCTDWIAVTMGSPTCFYFETVTQSEADDALIRDLEERSMKTAPVKESHQPGFDPGGAGVDSAYLQAKKDRLKKLQEEGEK